jgi:YHYH protein
MDVGGGHSGPGGLYHYHFEPSYLANDNSSLIGHLRDGFPIYGRRDQDNSYPTDLDVNGGHVGATAQYPEGIYHYHCATVNYLNGGYYVMKSGAYHGTKGPFTN